MIPLKASATFGSIRRDRLWNIRSLCTTAKRRESSSTTNLFPLRLFAGMPSDAEGCVQENIRSWKNAAARFPRRLRFFSAAPQGTYRHTLRGDRKFLRQWRCAAVFPELFPRRFSAFRKTNRRSADSVRMRCPEPECGCKKMRPKSRRRFLLKDRRNGKRREDRRLSSSFPFSDLRPPRPATARE